MRGIEAGLDHLEEATKLDGKQVVTFIELSSEREAKSYPAAVRVIRGSGCYSYVGMRRDMGIQNVSIGTGCTNLGNVAHEFMHALGNTTCFPLSSFNTEFYFISIFLF